MKKFFVLILACGVLSKTNLNAMDNVGLSREQLAEFIDSTRERDERHMIHANLITDYTHKLKAERLDKLFQEGFLQAVFELADQSDPEVALPWLQQKIALGQDFFLWELSKACAKLGKLEDSFFWYELARLRGLQDAACYIDESAQDFIQLWNEQYSLHLSELKPEWWLNAVYSKGHYERRAFQKVVGLKVLEVLKNWVYRVSPIWIHSARNQLDQRLGAAPLIPSEEWPEKRRAIIEAYERFLTRPDEKSPKPTYAQFLALCTDHSHVQKHATERKK